MKYVTFTNLSLLLTTDSEQISLKVLQTLGNDKVQVRFYLTPKINVKVLHNSGASVCAFQYGVPVIKYDRRGFKPRPRQLLLTNTYAILVDRTKIKQRLDYSALRGENPGMATHAG